ncbi:MAG: DKNYY domain-containing protein [Candidatus Moranbacteria bacterium]|nr:DKNYY domain-containing protein [Candidatus Moranbacteria bacterium]
MSKIDNKKIPTILGTSIIVIIAITVGVFVWKYEKMKIQEDVQVEGKAVELVKLGKKNNSNNQTEKYPIKEPQLKLDEQKKDCSDQKIIRICMKGMPVDGTDPKCIPNECVETFNGKETHYYSPFIKKDKRIYIENRYENKLLLIDGADYKTFQPLGTCASMEMSAVYYSKDKNNIYVGHKRMENIDYKSFKYLGSFSNGYGMPYSVSISKDKDHIYFSCGTIIDSIDRDSFKIVGNGYSKDKKSAYYLDHIIKNSDVKTFEAINYVKDSRVYGNFAIDKKTLYFEGLIVRDIDPLLCKKKGLQKCLSDSWLDLVDNSSGGERFKGAMY